MKPPRQQNPWWVTLRCAASEAPRLICLPYAGASASAYRSLCDQLAPNWEICAVQLPGRANRISEEPLRSMEALVDVLGDALGPILDRPYAVFGHSMGALIAVELVRWLRRRGRRQPLALVVSGRRPPHLEDTEAPVSSLNNDELLGELDRRHGMPREVLECGELQRVVIPMLRADFELCETYEYREDAPFGFPLTVLWGTMDPRTHHGLREWERYSNGTVVFRSINGGHLFIRDNQRETGAALQEALDRISCSSRYRIGY